MSIVWRICQRLAWVSNPYSCKLWHVLQTKQVVDAWRRVVCVRSSLYSWRKTMLVWRGTWCKNEVFLLLQAKVSISFGIYCLYFVPKTTRVPAKRSHRTRAFSVRFERRFNLKLYCLFRNAATAVALEKRLSEIFILELLLCRSKKLQFELWLSTCFWGCLPMSKPRD